MNSNMVLHYFGKATNTLQVSAYPNNEKQSCVSFSHFLSKQRAHTWKGNQRFQARSETNGSGVDQFPIVFVHDQQIE